MQKGYRLNLDDLFNSDYYYTKFDVGHYGHAIVIKVENKEEFLDAMAKEWRERAEEMLEEVVIRKEENGWEDYDIEDI